MKIKYLIAVNVVLLVCSMIAIGQKTVSADAEKAYNEMVGKVKAGDTKVDFKALRMAFTRTKDYGPYGRESESTKAAFAALEKKDFKDAVKKAEAAISERFVDMDAHIAASIAYKGLGDAAKADFQKAIYLGLVNSIISSGDGKTPDTAYVVITTHEEYVTLRALGLAAGGQSLSHVKGHTYDIQEATDSRTKTTSQVYFNIDIVWKAETEMFSK